MKGKAKEKRKIGKAILIGMGFFLTIILTFTTTLAWFYDSDWASKYINMAGTVGIEIQREKLDGEADDVNLRTSGTGNLYFHLYNDDGTNTPLAYPGQAIDVSASAYNSGGKSGQNGSECYIRAHFVVYTDIGKLPDPNNYKGTQANGGKDASAYIAAVEEYKLNNNIAAGVTPTDDELKSAGIKASDYISANGTGSDSAAYMRDKDYAEDESEINAEALYTFLYTLIAKQNALQATVGYYWHYYKHTGALALSDSGTSNQDLKYYMDGTAYSADGKLANDATSTAVNLTTLSDAGYFYLCYANTAENKTDLGLTADQSVPTGVLKPLGIRETAVFLWNNTFIIPWQLTNLSANKKLFVGVSFQAVQTFIPKMELTEGGISTGIINSDANNQLPATECTYNSVAVQTVFNSCKFKEIETTIDEINFGEGAYDRISEKDGVTNEIPAIPAS